MHKGRNSAIFLCFSTLNNYLEAFASVRYYIYVIIMSQKYVECEK